MRIGNFFLGAALLAAATLTGAGQASAQTYSLSAVLLGGNECDNTAPPAGPICRKGDPDGFGRATITFPNGIDICVTIQVDNLAGTTAAHVHSGRETVNGAIVVAIPVPNAPSAGSPGVASGCVALAPATQNMLRNNPAGFYINIHNAVFPAGAVRGQLF